MAAGMLMKVLCVAVAFIVVVAPDVEAANTCDKSIEKIKKCVPYLLDGGAVPPDCCSGLKGLNNDSKSTADKQAACDCIKSLVSAPQVKNPDNALGLPGKCQVEFPYKFSKTTDCSKVK